MKLIYFPLLTVLISLAQAPGLAQQKQPTEKKHQEGNTPILEGHKVLRYPIVLTEHLTAGEHHLGDLDIRGTKISVSVVANEKGEVTEIKTTWPKGIKPEHISDTTHPAYRAAAAGGISEVGAAKCVIMHASGRCAACSSFIWVEVIYDGPGFR